MSDNRALNAALLVSATALTSPHLLDYDLVLLAPALAFLTVVIEDDGARDYDKSLMALIWITPLLARSVGGLVGIPLGLFATLALFALILRRLHRQREHVTSEWIRHSLPVAAHSRCECQIPNSTSVAVQKSASLLQRVRHADFRTKATPDQ